MYARMELLQVCGVGPLFIGTSCKDRKVRASKEAGNVAFSGKTLSSLTCHCISITPKAADTWVVCRTPFSLRPQAYGLRPQFFLPHPDQVAAEGEEPAGSKAKSKAATSKSPSKAQ